jgi:hypothetical protein
MFCSSPVKRKRPSLLADTLAACFWDMHTLLKTLGSLALRRRRKKSQKEKKRKKRKKERRKKRQTWKLR